MKGSKCPRECWGPFGVVGDILSSIAGVERLESRVQVIVLLLVLLAAAYFFFMATKAMFIDTSSRISEIVEVCSDVLFNFLVVLVRVFEVVAPSSPWRGCPSSRCWSAKRLWLGQ